MTEASFQEGRKVMQRANYLRGSIIKCKGNVAKWTKIEDSFRKELKEAQADGAKKMLDIAMIKLGEARNKLSELKFPPNELPNTKLETIQCERCGSKVTEDDTYCNECIYGY